MADFYFKTVGDLNSFNDVNIVKLNGYTLPEDVQFSINYDKMIAQSQILDGVVVYERVTRKPAEITFEFTLREKKSKTPVIGVGGAELNLATQTKYVFPMQLSKEIIQSVFNVDSVLKVENSYLNSVGIFQVVVSEMGIQLNRGTVNVPVRMRCYEDTYTLGQQAKTLNTNTD